MCLRKQNMFSERRIYRFYEYDYLFERLWRNPRRYLPILQRYNGVILPDFSLYRDMPRAVTE